jgi:DNA-binding Lrp family transcriptional regulator
MIIDDIMRSADMLGKCFAVARIERSEIRDRRPRMSPKRVIMRARRRERRPLPPAAVFAGLPLPADGRTEARMVPFFVQIKCQLGQSYDVANKLADAELASEIYSTAGDFDLLVKFYVEDKTDIGHFVNEKVQTIPGIQDTRTIITFKAF